MIQPIKISMVRIDGGTQPRVAISEDTVSEYAEAMASDTAQMPAVDLFFDGVTYWLADGFHRYHAARKNGLDHVVATIHQGTRRDAVLFSVGANQSHGLRRTNDDKRRAVLTLMNDGEWSKWSNAEIARRCGVGHQLANDIRISLAETASETVTVERTYKTKHGTEATMKTENIGRASKRDERRKAIAEMVAAGKPSIEIQAELKTSPSLIAEVRREMGVGREQSKSAIQQRREQMRSMAADGYSVRQIAAAVGLDERTVAVQCRQLGIEVVANKVMGKVFRHDSNRIVEHMVMDAENLTADVNLIDFDTLDNKRLSEWIARLNRSHKALGSFVRQLVKKMEQHGEAA